MPIYFDHNATSPPHPDVLAEALPFVTEFWGNPSSGHAMGRKPFAAVEVARARVAKWAGARSKEVVFTSGATEANHLALRGVGRGRQIWVSSVEHPSVRVTGEKLGAKVIPVDSEGRVVLEALDAVGAGDLVSIMAANNETGVIQDVVAIAERVHARGALLHVDAAQVVGRIEAPGAWDLLTITGHKAGGFKGVGALLVREGIPVEPQQVGGGQERGLRSGTVNPAPIVALGKVTELRYPARVGELRDRFEAAVIELGGRVLGAGARRLPNTTAAFFPDVAPELVVMGLDIEGVCVSSGSACSTGAAKPSHVLVAMGAPVSHAVRFSIGFSTTPEEIDAAIVILREVVAQAREAGGGLTE